MSSELPHRVLPALLVLSALGFSGIAVQEGYSNKATIPVDGDKPTYGLGSTTKPDGQQVKLGDSIAVPAAIQLAVRQAEKKEAAIRRCVTAPLAQYEYDVYVSLAYNVGESAFCKSTLVKKANAMDYAGACAEILRWRYFQGKDCSQPENQRLCGGIWGRRQQEAARCQGGSQ